MDSLIWLKGPDKKETNFSLVARIRGPPWAAAKFFAVGAAENNENKILESKNVFLIQTHPRNGFFAGPLRPASGNQNRKQYSVTK